MYMGIWECSMHACLNMRLCMYIAYMYIYIYVCMCVYICMYVLPHLCIRALAYVYGNAGCMSVHEYIYAWYVRVTLPMYTSFSVCILHESMYVCMHTCICMYV